MIEEIPYGKYVENINDSTRLNELEKSLPVSIEVIPHTAIIVNEVYEVRRQHRDENRECPDYVKWLIASSFCIPVVIVLSSIRLSN